MALREEMEVDAVLAPMAHVPVARTDVRGVEATIARDDVRDDVDDSSPLQYRLDSLCGEENLLCDDRPLRERGTKVDRPAVGPHLGSRREATSRRRHLVSCLTLFFCNVVQVVVSEREEEQSLMREEERKREKPVQVGEEETRPKDDRRRDSLCRNKRRDERRRKYGDADDVKPCLVHQSSCTDVSNRHPRYDKPVPLSLTVKPPP